MGYDPTKPDLTRTLHRGRRVMLRYRLSGGSLTDVVGDLTEVDRSSVTIDTRSGPVIVRRADIVTGREVPPRPVRRGRPHRAIGIPDLQELMVEGMPPIERRWLGRWLLRASAGYTGRGNSVLPLGDPGMPSEQAHRELEHWSAAHGIPPRVQLFGPSGFDPRADPLVRDLPGEWEPVSRTLVLTAAAAQIAGAPPAPGPAGVRVTDHLTESWLAAATERERQNASALHRMLDGSPGQHYLTLQDAEAAVAAARISIHPGWAGLFSVHVAPEARRRGLGREITRQAADLAAGQADSIYLQVEASNEPAVELYRGLGFEPHHEYWYLRPLGR